MDANSGRRAFLVSLFCCVPSQQGPFERDRPLAWPEEVMLPFRAVATRLNEEAGTPDPLIVSMLRNQPTN